MTFLWMEETGSVSRFTPRTDRPTRYYMRQDHFCETCGAEWSGPAPKPRTSWTQRIAWVASSILAGLLWAWALFGVVWS